MVYLSLDKKYVLDNIDKWEQSSLKLSGEEDGKGTLILDDNETEGHIDEINEEKSTLFVVVEDAKLGYISVEVKLSPEDFLDLIEMSIKKLNKLKAILEGLK